MSNVYIQEPPALGKVLLKTSVGDIDLELWTKEAPRACRNFIQLCMEGYYNGTIFHRVVPDFIVQGGDPSGDGTGGESVYGAPFKDEFHSRLRFNRRGLVAMANAGKDDNSSQFFFTLGATPELQNKHTIFGKVTGETVFNMLKLAEGDIGADERPTYPHKISGAVILINPFEDIVPRVVAEEVSKPVKSSKKERKGTKNFGLLSFGAEAEEEEGEGAEYRGKAKSTHDLLDDPKLSRMTAAEMDLPEETPRVEDAASSEPSAAVTSVREKLKSKKRIDKIEHKKEDKKEEKKEDSESEGEYYLGKDKEIARRKERDRIRNEISQLKKDMKKPKAEIGTEADEESSKPSSEKDNELKKQYEDEQEKYRKLKEKIPKKGAARQDYTLALLEKFKSKLSAVREKSSAESEAGAGEASRDDDDVSGDDWLGHRLHFDSKTPVLAKDASTKGDDWFDIYDPRNPLNKRKREESEKIQKAKMRK